jgi:hypothetical protein
MLLSAVSYPLLVFVQLVASQIPQCNPKETFPCPPIRGWPTERYTIDFRKHRTVPHEWKNWSAIQFDNEGATFRWRKPGDAPQLWTDFWVFGGRYDVEMTIARGQGIITAITLWSEVRDEIDWEFSGNQNGMKPFPSPDGFHFIETHGFKWGDGIGVSKWKVRKPVEYRHVYSVSWDKDLIEWFVDGQRVRRFGRLDSQWHRNHFPDTPMKLQIGIWAGGDPRNAPGTINWAGGPIEPKKAPFLARVVAVNITSYRPACAYNYTDNVRFPHH